MADTVLSMARSMVGGALSKAASAAADEMSLLMGVRKDIWFIKDELETMQAFLVAAEAMKEKDLLLKVWAKQVRDLSYNIEDCLGEFMVHVASQSLSQQLMKLKDRHRIAMQIRDLKSRLEEVSNRNTRYNLIDKNQVLARAFDERDCCMEDIRNQSGSNIDEAELVGFSKPKEELIKLLDNHARNGPARVVCVVGMGGLGKTTLTRKVYESMENFSCCAWITVSQSFFRMDLLKGMIKQLLGDQALKKQLEANVVQEDSLAEYLRKALLEKRYFVVLDDLWNLDDWKWIKSIAFPSSNTKGSRIIVTTRDVGLAKECTLESSRPLIYHHEPLETNYAIKLLLKKTGKSEEDMKNYQMKEIVTKIAPGRGFFYMPDQSSSKLIKERATSVVITIIEGSATCREIEQSFNIIFGDSWRCTARAIGPNQYTMRFPTPREVERAVCYGASMKLKTADATVSLSPWTTSVGAKAPLQKAWVKISNIPLDKRCEANVFYAGGLIGVSLDLDASTLHKPKYVKVLVGCRDIEMIPLSAEGCLGDNFYDFYYEVDKIVVGRAPRDNINVAAGNSGAPSPKRQRFEQSNNVTEENSETQLISSQTESVQQRRQHENVTITDVTEEVDTHESEDDSIGG
ncbi:hypothetical protein ACQ4PT_025070 [Festuca glaucescens]